MPAKVVQTNGIEKENEIFLFIPEPIEQREKSQAHLELCRVVTEVGAAKCSLPYIKVVQKFD